MKLEKSVYVSVTVNGVKILLCGIYYPHTGSSSSRISNILLPEGKEILYLQPIKRPKPAIILPNLATYYFHFGNKIK